MPSLLLILAVLCIGLLIGFQWGSAPIRRVQRKRLSSIPKLLAERQPRRLTKADCDARRPDSDYPETPSRLTPEQVAAFRQASSIKTPQELSIEQKRRLGEQISKL